MAFLADPFEALPFLTLFFLELPGFLGALFFLADLDFFDFDGVFFTGAFLTCFFLAGVLLFPFLALAAALALEAGFLAVFLTGFEVFLLATDFFLLGVFLEGATLLPIYYQK